MKSKEVIKIRKDNKKIWKDYYKLVMLKIQNYQRIRDEIKKSLPNIKFEGYYIWYPLHEYFSYSKISVAKLEKYCIGKNGDNWDYDTDKIKEIIGSINKWGYFEGDAGKVIIILNDLLKWLADIDYDIEKEIKEQEYLKACMDLSKK